MIIPPFISFQIHILILRGVNEAHEPSLTPLGWHTLTLIMQLLAQSCTCIETQTESVYLHLLCGGFGIVLEVERVRLYSAHKHGLSRRTLLPIFNAIHVDCCS